MIVVDMDMPKTCGTCKFSVGFACEKWLKLYPDEMASKKADDCPIVAEIPQKHGRLIDADKFINSLKGIQRLHEDDELRNSILDTINTNILVEAEADKESGE